MWELQIEYNIIVMVLFIIYFRGWLSRGPNKQIRKVYCILRDCWYIKPLLEKYLGFGGKVDFLYCSRKSLTDTSMKKLHQPTIDHFINHATSDSVWIDVSGSGNSMMEFTRQFGADPHQVNVVRLDTPSRRNGLLSTKVDQMALSSFVPTRLELINSAPFGSFIRWESDKAVLDDLEYPIEFINAGTDAINYCIEHGHIEKLLNSLADVSIDNNDMIKIISLLENDQRADLIFEKYFERNHKENFIDRLFIGSILQ